MFYQRHIHTHPHTHSNLAQSTERERQRPTIGGDQIQDKVYRPTPKTKTLRFRFLCTLALHWSWSRRRKKRFSFQYNMKFSLFSILPNNSRIGSSTFSLRFLGFFFLGDRLPKSTLSLEYYIAARDQQATRSNVLICNSLRAVVRNFNQIN